MTDRERILTALVSQLHSTLLLAPCCRGYKPEDFGDYAHFAHYKKPAKGDLVFAGTGPNSEWKLAWFVADIPGGALVREIGSNKTCNYTNESFTPVVGMRQNELYETDQHAMYVKIKKAFHKGDEYLYRFGGCEFAGQEVVIWIREVFGGALATKDAPSVPFSVRMAWGRKTTIREILAAMRAGGYGTKSFRGDSVSQPNHVLGRDRNIR